MEKAGKADSNSRIRTIDVLRALTMFLMIFVNNLWSLTGVPKWLEHTSTEEDGMGFSDVIFPLFLFIVGLSIPLAINIRLRKNQTRWEIIGHILMRTIALLVMGFYMVNFENINQQAMALNESVWQILMALAIFLIWMDYKRLPNLSNSFGTVLKVIGLLILGYLAWVYKGGTVDEVSWMQPHWWGILGLIGWAYLINALLYLSIGKKWGYFLLAFAFLMLMNVQENGFFKFLPSFKLVISASNHVLVLSGVLCTVFYLKFKEEGKSRMVFLLFASMAALLLMAYGFLIRPTFPISKNLATPSWTAICMGISLLSYALFYLIVERGGYHKWAEPVKPAGTSTLTCYLMPYFIYPAIVLIGFEWPKFLSNGILGLVKSLLFSLAIILFVGFLEKRHIRLKI